MQDVTIEHLSRKNRDEKGDNIKQNKRKTNHRQFGRNQIDVNGNVQERESLEDQAEEHES